MDLLLAHAVEWARTLSPHERVTFLARFDPSSRAAIERALQETDHALRHP